MNPDNDMVNRDDGEQLHLSSGGIAVIEATVSRHIEARRADLAGGKSESIKTSDFVAYLAGALPSESAQHIEYQATRHRELRARLTATADTLYSLQELPWSEVSRRSAVAGLEGEVAAAWISLASERVSAIPHARAAWIELGWRRLAQGLAENALRAQVAWSAAATFAGQIRSAMSMPTLAAARGSVDAGLLVVDPERVLDEFDIRLARCEVTADGDLEAVVLVTGGGRSSNATGITVTLAIRLGDSLWPLDSAAIDDGSATVRLAAAGSMFGLPRGPIPAGFLALLVGEVTEPTAGHHRQTLIAEIFDDGAVSGEPSGHCAIAIIGPARWSDDGAVSLDIVLGAAPRLAYPDYDVELLLAVTSQTAQCLGRWPVRDWPADGAARTIVARCDGVSANLSVDNAAAFLKIRIRPH